MKCVGSLHVLPIDVVTRLLDSPERTDCIDVHGLCKPDQVPEDWEKAATEGGACSSSDGKSMTLIRPRMLL